ncbi:MAG: hypothetical protein AAGN35_02270 [Bacteroidota bacterium]
MGDTPEYRPGEFPGYGSLRETGIVRQLDPASLQVMGKSEELLLQFLEDFAGMVRYFGRDNQVSGTWKDLLDSDISFILAQISIVELGDEPVKQAELSKAYQATSFFGRKEELIVEMFLNFLRLTLVAGTWFTKIQSVLNREIGLGNRDTVVEFLNPIYNEMKGAMETNLSPSVVYVANCWLEMNATFLTPPQQLTDVPIMDQLNPFIPMFKSVYADLDDIEVPNLGTYDAQFKYLQTIAGGILRTAAVIKDRVPQLLQMAAQYPAHQPHNALLLAFLQMLTPQIEQMNQLPARHLDFYYQEVLRMNPKGAQPDQVLLAFRLKPNAEISLVPAKSPLSAGQAKDGEPILFATDQDLVVNKIVLEGFKSVFNSGIGRKVAAEGKLYSDVQTSAPKAAWRPFGSVDDTPASLAQVGFAIGSPAFFLASGERTVTLFFELTADTFPLLTEALFPFVSKYENIFRLFEQIFSQAFTLHYSTAKGWEAAGMTVTPRLCYPGYDCGVVPEDKMGFWLEFALSANAPAWVSPTAKVHETGYDSAVPLLQVMLDQSVETEVFDAEKQRYSVSPYNFLRPLAVAEVDITVSVSRYTDFIPANARGAFPKGKPFLPFGSHPIQYAEFYLGSSEVFRKQLTDLQVDINWKNLPTGPTGFSQPYAAYNELSPETPFNNAVFRVDFGLLQDGSWHAMPPLRSPRAVGPVVTDFPLFAWKTAAEEELETGTDTETSPTPSPGQKKTSLRPPVDWLVVNVASDRGLRYQRAVQEEIVEDAAEIEGEGRLQTTTPFEGFTLSGLPATFAEGPGVAESGYQPGTSSGFVRIRLTAPEYAFGSGLYQDVLTIAAQNNMRTIIAATRPGTSSSPPVSQRTGSPPTSSEIQFSKLPKPPFAPEIKSITGSYSAKARIRAGKPGQAEGSYFRIHPFGVVADPMNGAVLEFLPNYPVQGEFFLALSGQSDPDVASLLIQVDESTSDLSVEPPPIDWAWLSGTEWVDFTPAEIDDGTDGLLASGILAFDINGAPQGTAATFNGIPEEAGYLWIRGQVQQHASGVCELVQVLPHGTTASRVLNPGSVLTTIPAGTIKKLDPPIPAIAKVEQPMPSFGGRASEDNLDFLRRISERLRHKQRGVTAWDLEHLTLQEFPEIGLARCFNHVQFDQTEAPGHALLAVLPALGDPSVANYLQPRVPQNVLHRVEQYLNELVAGVMGLEVHSPSFATLQVMAVVRIASGHLPGPTLKNLNQALQQRIAPWAYATGINPYRTKITYADLLEFVKKQPGIGDVRNFRVFLCQKEDGQNVYSKITGEFTDILPWLPWSVITTVEEHLLYAEQSISESASFEPLGILVDAPNLILSEAEGAVTLSPEEIPNCVVIVPNINDGEPHG